MTHALSFIWPRFLVSFATIATVALTAPVEEGGGWHEMQEDRDQIFTSNNHMHAPDRWEPMQQRST